MSWIAFTIAATILQTFRNLEQKSLNKKLDTLTVSWSRFILPLPLALVTTLYTSFSADVHFILLCAVTAFFQISGNFFLLRTFKSKNFSVGIAFYKTEVLQALLLGILFFHQDVSKAGFAAIVLTSLGMILMSNFSFSWNKTSPKNLQKDSGWKLDKVALFGALTGLCFSISAFSLKFAAEQLMLVGYGYAKAAVIVLMWVICFQNLFFVVLKSSQNRLRQDWQSLFAAENKSSFFKTGLLSFAGSVCWFIAYAIGNVVYVKAVGQLELVLAVLISYLHLKENHTTKDFVGIALTSLGILVLILFH